VAEAVVAAVDARAQVEDAEVIDVGGDQVGVVRLSRGVTSLMGAALKFADEYDAVAHATLHALRRTAEMSAPPEPGSR
jgi:hypothetical protein